MTSSTSLATSLTSAIQWRTRLSCSCFRSASSKKHCIRTNSARKRSTSCFTLLNAVACLNSK
ncbi:hypothetical protein PanWU01x14_151080 [Parasponia andersonii]|uniref:Uncharacterized protein n=1 Tax=Parasponia andersonii TaxID=3476 RepID=A0A2P5CI16_PARAD|nr:hypothetical protein PanWU01x14_151080 [Parasponia andersonii]